jgi:CpXC protein
MIVDKPFYYTDLKRKLVFKVLPRAARYRGKDAAARLLSDIGQLPAGFAKADARKSRVVLGVDELREKLIAADAGLDDRVVELLKQRALHKHPLLLKKPGLRLMLDRVGSGRYEFVATCEHSQRRFRIRVSQPTIKTRMGRYDERVNGSKKSHRSSDIFERQGDCVKLRQRSPQAWPLTRLQSLAKQIRHGRALDMRSSAFRQTIASLPHGGHLPPSAKRDLQVLLDYAKRKNLHDVEDDLFEIRFGMELETMWSNRRKHGDNQMLEELLRSFPDINGESNTFMSEMLLDSD